MFSVFVTCKDLTLLKKIASNNDIIVSRPDKDEGAVGIVWSRYYTDSLNALKLDPVTFVETTEPIQKVT